MQGAWAMVLAMCLSLAALLFVIVIMIRSVERERSAGTSVWRGFALGLSLMVLFLVTWVGQGVAQWQTHADEQRAHAESVEAGGFVSEFAHSTLENWQSEFLQLFAFVVLAAFFVYKGSAESKDSDERMEASLRRIKGGSRACPLSRRLHPARTGSCRMPQLDDIEERLGCDRLPGCRR